MAPKVTVPTDFGKHLINSPGHGNLAIQLQEGADIKVNSAILSFNSPVIYNLTTNLHQTYLEMQDFQRSAVERFVEAMYSGEMEGVDSTNFRDFHKLSLVFDVSWLVDRCDEYFKSQVDGVDGHDYEETLFVVEEARYSLNKLKKRNHLDYVAERMGNMKTQRDVFFERYLMTDFSNCSKDQLDLVLELIGPDSDGLVAMLTKHITANTKSLDDNMRYLLSNINVSLCERNDSEICDKLMEALSGLESTTNSDFKMLLNLIERSRTPSKSLRQTKKRIKELSNVSLLPDMVRECSSFDQLLTVLSESQEVTNSYIFYDALWIYMCQGKGGSVTFDKNLTDRILKIHDDLQLDPILKSYIAGLFSDDDTRKLTATFMSFDKIHAEPSSCFLFPSQEVFDFDSSFILTERKLSFQFPKPESCSLAGKCGVVFKVTPATVKHPESFNIALSADKEDYPADLHFHPERIDCNNFHLALQRTHTDGRVYNVPLSWNGKPQLHSSGTYWKWGMCYFGRECDPRCNQLIWDGPQWECYFGISRDCKHRLIVVYMKSK